MHDNNKFDPSKTYDLILRRHPARSFEVGTALFNARPARFIDLDAPGFDEADILEFVTIGSITASRFRSLANINPLEQMSDRAAIDIPSLYLHTDDDRKGYSVAGAGGLQDALRFSIHNGSNALMPVALVFENNHVPVRAADLDERLFNKLRHGISARGRSDGNFVSGMSFDAVVTPTNHFLAKDQAVETPTLSHQ